MAFERSRAPVDLAYNCFHDRVGRWRNRSRRLSARSSNLPDGLVLDSELVVPAADGRSDFEQVRRRNLIQRPRMIQEGAAKSRHVTPGPRVQLIEHVETHGEALFDAIAAQDFEGIVAKRVDAPYRAGQQHAWVKMVHLCDGDFEGE